MLSVEKRTSWRETWYQVNHKTQKKPIYADSARNGVSINMVSGNVGKIGHTLVIIDLEKASESSKVSHEEQIVEQLARSGLFMAMEFQSVMECSIVILEWEHFRVGVCFVK
jgi:hypothetical protein